MLTIKSILCPVDFSKFSASAYDYAQSLAEHYHASVSLLHVVRPGAAEYLYVGANNTYNRDLEDYAKDAIRQFAYEHKHTEVKPAVYAPLGAVRKTILEFAGKQRTDLIVMGTHGHSEGARGLLGSVTDYVLRHASRPVLAVRAARSDSTGPNGKLHGTVRIQKILFCTDLSPFSERALPYALSLATEYGADLTLLHVIEEGPGKHDTETKAARVMEEMERLIPKQTSGSLTIKSLVRTGKAYNQIVRYEAESGTDLVVMGIHGRNVVDLALLGSTTHRVLQLGMAPVITIGVDRLAGELAQPTVERVA